MSKSQSTGTGKTLHLTLNEIYKTEPFLSLHVSTMTHQPRPAKVTHCHHQSHPPPPTSPTTTKVTHRHQSHPLPPKSLYYHNAIMHIDPLNHLQTVITLLPHKPNHHSAILSPCAMPCNAVHIMISTRTLYVNHDIFP